MRTATIVTQMLIRLCFLVLLVLGVLFWTGHAVQLVSLHMAIGGIFVLGLWFLAALGARAKVGMGLVANAAVGGFIVLGLGMTQTTVMVGDMHWLVRVVHLLVGTAAIGISEQIGARIRK
ncbi:MAG: hypothetical protein WBQ26_10275 [Gemmatimonadaceae bacterium]|nr:hypothetical protein [Gemmatimonadaceae bacterium]